ncbi:regulatory signaling modulator protein AmpE [Thiohalomonas denitrificans]|uniref:AmpE protein n=1 Tax=Thiohalomonas denitrificans TaxID=415747 RepID=A0A1G5Q7D6_9GAMM|nr:regulatory signaling modulator protein AmpE [Thiohalomonas denitrificans]SCZ57380.1 AmpE protein [Thiohalomonas denitrificans]
MSLIAIIFALFVEHFLGSLEELRRFDWFTTFSDRVRDRLPAGRFRDGPFGVLLVIGLPVIGVGLVGYALEELWGVLGFIYAVLILLYAFGPRDLEAEVEAFADARERNDEDSARWHAASLLGGEVPEEPETRARVIIETILVEAHERVLGIIFWFLLLGPVGAILYRLSRVLEARYRGADEGFGLAAWRLHYVLAWVPARLCAFSYALAGSFVDAMQRWRNEAWRYADENRGALVSAGFGGLRYDPAEQEDGHPDQRVETENVRETLALVRRAAIIWVAVLAVFTLAGWLG